MTTGITMPVSDLLDLVRRLISRGNAPSEAALLRADILGDGGGTLDAILTFAYERQLGGLVLASLAQKGIIHPDTTGLSHANTPRARLGEMQVVHDRRRQAALREVGALIQTLNGAGIEPLLLKGAAASIDGGPAWREHRDIDLAVPPDRVDDAFQCLRNAGYGLVADAPNRFFSKGHHHFDPLIKEGDVYSIELHRRIGSGTVMPELPCDALQNAALRKLHSGMAYWTLRPAHKVLHGLAHHHFGNDGVVFGVINPKGLAEFGHDLETLDEAEVAEVLHVVGLYPRLRNALSLWLAAAEMRLNIPPPVGLRYSIENGRDAARAWERLSQGPARGRKAGLHEMAFAVTQEAKLAGTLRSALRAYARPLRLLRTRSGVRLDFHPFRARAHGCVFR